MPGGTEPVGHLPWASACVQLLEGPSPTHPLFGASRNYSAAYTWWLPASEPSFPPAKVGQMDVELPGVSVPHVLGPGQSPCHCHSQVCTCTSPLVVLLTKPCYLLLLFLMIFSFLFLFHWIDQPRKCPC